MEVLIFKTNVYGKRSLNKIAPLFDKHMEVSKWNFDLEDCDKILRIEASSKISKQIIHLLESKGFECEELFYER